MGAFSFNGGVWCNTGFRKINSHDLFNHINIGSFENQLSLEEIPALLMDIDSPNTRMVDSMKFLIVIVATYAGKPWYAGACRGAAD